MTPIIAINTLWCLWWASWLAASLWSRKTVKRAGIGYELLHRLPLIAGIILVFGFYGGLDRMEIGLAKAVSGAPGWVLTALVAAGFGFCWWARLTLGSLWSGSVTRKDDHRIVEKGPYRLVRHPIYTGLILAALATAAAYATPVSFIGAAVITASLAIKAKIEERFLREELGTAYDDYAAKVPMLVPFVRS